MANTHSDQPLFPMFPSKACGGMAGLAALATDAGAGHDVAYKVLPVKSILNRTSSKRGLSLAYSINPYRGCEFACKYCYARYTHSFFANSSESKQPHDFQDPSSFEHLIFLKENAAWLLEQELSKMDPALEIALGTATDPYQPIERTAKVTRSLLEVFARKRDFRLGIVTKSQLILRDLDLLKQIAEHNTLVIHLTVTTPDASLARILEPRAPRPDLRLDAAQRLRQAGLTTGILCSPLLPGITDSAESINRMAGEAASVQASFFAAEPLFLKTCSRPTYLQFLQEHFPHLERETRERFEGHDFADAPYRALLQSRVREACRLNKIVGRSMDALLTREIGSMKFQPASARQGQLFTSAQ